jgi:hypothetical protein
MSSMAVTLEKRNEPTVTIARLASRHAGNFLIAQIELEAAHE